LNLQNPAAYAALNRSTLAFGGNHSRINLLEETKNGKAVRSSFDYFAVGLPVGKVGVGFGLMPYSSVGYSIKSFTNDGKTDFSNTYKGTGGVNRVYLSTGFKISKNFNFGIEGNYNFGNIETTSTSISSIQYGTKTFSRSDLSGLGLSVGLQFQKQINKKLSVYSSFSYAPESRMTSSNIQKAASIATDGTETEFNKNDDLGSETTIKLPSKTTFGLGFGQSKKWFAGFEVTKQNSNTFTNIYKTDSNATYEDATRFSFGAYLIPNYAAYSGYWKKVTYRAGFRHENTGLVVKQVPIKETAITAGLGLPLNGVYSNINIGLEYGSRGTIYSGLIRENFITVLISLSLNDKWFNKRKID
jgi:hypothetical protein